MPKLAVAVVVALMATAAAAQTWQAETIWSGDGWRVFKWTQGGGCFASYDKYSDDRVWMGPAGTLTTGLIVRLSAERHDKIYFQLDGGKLHGPVGEIRPRSPDQPFTSRGSFYITLYDLRSASRLAVVIKPPSGPEYIDTSRPDVTYDIELGGARAADSVLRSSVCLR